MAPMPGTGLVTFWVSFTCKPLYTERPTGNRKNICPNCGLSPPNAQGYPRGFPVSGSVAFVAHDPPKSADSVRPKPAKSAIVADPAGEPGDAGCKPGHPPGPMAWAMDPAPQSAMVFAIARRAAAALNKLESPVRLTSMPSSVC